MCKTTVNIHSIDQSLKRLKSLIQQLKGLKNLQERLNILNESPEVYQFVEECLPLKNFLKECSEQNQYILKSLLIIGQGPVIFQGIDQHPDTTHALKVLLEKLRPVEKFYNMMGGIIGYHVALLQLILENESKNVSQWLQGNEKFFKPPGHDISQNNIFVRTAVKNYLENMPFLAEIYPVGGAGDRLNLKDELTGEDLPSAELMFDGRTLLEGLIRDLQAREFLYYKLYGKQLSVPIAMMTSDEKNNDDHIKGIIKRMKGFGRPLDAYEFFKQPLVPVLTIEGDWVVTAPLELKFKPGGHGVIWKLALDAGVIDRLIAKGHSKALVRQINNPMAGTDYGLMAFVGCGIKNQKRFGFASCPRLLNTAEGMNVLIEKNENSTYAYCISNIEYPDFIKKGIHDIPESPDSSFSAFPANTNLLFVDLTRLKDDVASNPVPGMLINMKHKTHCLTSKGVEHEIPTGRLESLMQNLADKIVDRFPSQQTHLKPEDLSTFLTYNERRKTISVTKKLHKSGESIVETPEGCYFDQLTNTHELLTKFCGMKIPQMPSEKEYVEKGPNFIFSFHPALGPIYALIAQKIQGGSIDHGSEVNLEIAEIFMHHVHLSGSLLIEAENIVGHPDSQGITQYSQHVGRCVFKNVKIKNEGIDKSFPQVYWKKQISRKESLKIYLKGCSEFIAEDVTFEGNIEIEVLDGQRIIAKNKNGKLILEVEPLTQTQRWNYTFDTENNIRLIISE